MEMAESLKYLGVNINQHVKWDIQATHIFTTLLFLLFKFNCPKQILIHLKTVFHALLKCIYL